MTRRGELLDETQSTLAQFSKSADKLEQWFGEVSDAIDPRDVSKLEFIEYSAKMDALSSKKETKREEFEETIRGGKNLIGKKDVTDTVPVRDRVKVYD